MTARLVASGFMLLVLAGCGWSRGQDSTPGPPALQAASQLPTTGRSAPVPRIGTLGLAGIARSAVSLGIGTTGSPVPRESLAQGHAAYEPDAARAGLQGSARTHPGVATTPGSDVDHTISAVHRRFASARLLAPHLTGSCPAFSTTLTTVALDDSSSWRFGADT